MYVRAGLLSQILLGALIFAQSVKFSAPQPYTTSSLSASELMSFPSRTVVNVVARDTDAKDQFKCLGVFTGPTDIRTVGHCILDSKGALLSESSIDIELPDYLRSIGVGPKMRVVKLHYRDDWKPNLTSTINLEGIRLSIEEPIGDLLGYVGVFGYSRSHSGSLKQHSNLVLETCKADLLKSSDFRRFGDPISPLIVAAMDQDRRWYINEGYLKKLKGCMLITSGSQLRLAKCGLGGIWDEMLATNCPTEDGDSGSPLFFVQGGQAIAFAMHSHRVRNDDAFGALNRTMSVFFTGAVPKPIVSTKVPLRP